MKAKTLQISAPVLGKQVGKFGSLPTVSPQTLLYFYDLLLHTARCSQALSSSASSSRSSYLSIRLPSTVSSFDSASSLLPSCMARGRKRRRPETVAEREITEIKEGRGDGGTEVGGVDNGILGDGENEVQWETKREEEDGLVTEGEDGKTLRRTEGEDNGEEEKGFNGGEDGGLECGVSITSPTRSLRKKARVSYNDEVYEFDESDDDDKIPFKNSGRRGRKKKVFSPNRNVSDKEDQRSPMEEDDKEEISFRKPGRRGRKKKVFSSNRNVFEEEEQRSPVEEADDVRETNSGDSGNRRGSSRRKRGGKYAQRKQIVVKPEGEKRINKLDPEVRIDSF